MKLFKISRMLGINLFYKFFRLYALGSCLNHYWRTVRIVGAEVQALIAVGLLESDPYISLQIFYKMAYMNWAVCVRYAEGFRGLRVLRNISDATCL